MKPIRFVAISLVALFLSLSAAGQENVKLVPQWPAVNESLLYHVQTQACLFEDSDTTYAAPTHFDMRLTTEQMNPDKSVLLGLHYENLPETSAITDEIRKDTNQLTDALKEEMSEYLEKLDGHAEFDGDGNLVRAFANPDALSSFLDKVQSLCGNRKDVANMMIPLLKQSITQETLDSQVAAAFNGLFSLSGKELPLGMPFQTFGETPAEIPMLGQVTYKQRIIYNANYTDDSHSAILVQVVSKMLPGESDRLAEAIIDKVLQMAAGMSGNADPKELEEARGQVKEMLGAMHFNWSVRLTYLIDAATNLPHSCTSNVNSLIELGNEGGINSLITKVYTLE